MKIIIITAPSGAGKTTILKQIMQLYPQLRFSISACTRAPRSGEIDGKDYHFLSVTDFQNMISNSEFLEWEMVYQDKYYGTPKSEITRISNDGNIPIVDIDVKGALNIKKMYGDQSLSIFIQPPSIDELRNRLIKRNTETPTSLAERIARAEFELQYAHQFDVCVVNEVIEDAVNEVSNAIGTYLK